MAPRNIYDFDEDEFEELDRKLAQRSLPTRLRGPSISTSTSAFASGPSLPRVLPLKQAVGP